MKTRILCVSISLLFIVFMALNLFCEDAYVPTDNEEIYGIWINQEYGTTEASFSQKRIINPDGTWEEYSSMIDIGFRTLNYTIIDKWTESEGNIWYKLRTEYGGKEYGTKPFYELHKISNSGLTWEFVRSAETYPTQIDPNHPMYFIYYRQ